MSLRTRLLIGLGFVIVVALAAADVATYSSLRSFLLTRVDQSLVADHHQVEAVLDGEAFQGPGGPPGGPGGPSQNQEGQLQGQYAIEVQGSVSITPLAYHDHPDSSTGYLPKLPVTITGFRLHGGIREPSVFFDAASAEPGGPQFRVLAFQYHGATVVMAAPLTATNQTLHRLLLIELAVTGAAILLAIAGGWWLVRLGLRPLRDIEHTAGAIAAGELDQRVPGENATTEVGRLARALNVMLGRIQDAFAARDRTEAALRDSQTRLRQFVADASHELRTPVAAVSAYAELFERGANTRPDDLARVMSGIRGETSRMGHLVDDLLLLARMDEHLPIEHEPVELVAVAAEAAQAARAVGPEWPITLRADHPVDIVGDRGRLRQVFDNLLGNVRAHTPPGTAARIHIGVEADHAVVTIEDDGPGITEDDAARVFERFYRVDPSRSRASGGAGLGLSIVAAIVDAHGGTASAAPGAKGTGAVFTIRMPTQPS